METTHPARLAGAPLSFGAVLTNGLYAGAIGACVVAAWFLVLDALAGRPYATPNLLGTWIIAGQHASKSAPIDPAMVAAYTAVHVVAFVVFGALAATLFALSARHPMAGIALIFLFVFFEAAFFMVAGARGGDLLGALGVWAVAIGNLLAAAGMAAYLWWRHPGLREHLGTRIWQD